MSLINQMLKDLESRQQGGAPHQATTVPRTGGAPRRLPLLLLGGVVAALSMAGLLVWRFVPATDGALPVAIEQPAEPAAGREPAAVPPLPMAPVEVPLAVSREAAPLSLPETVSLQAVRLREFDAFVHLEIDFDRPPTYHIALAQDRRRLQVILTAVALAADLPPVTGHRSLAALEAAEQGDALLLELQVQPATRIGNYSATMQVAGGGYRLLLDLYPEAPSKPAEQQGLSDHASTDAGAKAVTAPVSAPAEGDHKAHAQAGQAVAAAAPETVPARPLRRTVSEPSVAELAEQAYRRAQAALAGGRSPEGEAALLLALERHPGHLAARQLLVAELLRQQRHDRAGQVLAEGLRLHPEHLPLRLRYAELLMSRGAAAQARDLLLAGPQPSPAAAPQLHALLGALFQRLGQYRAAADRYQALLATQPDNGLWHMGLAIAHEYAGAPDQAVSAYRAALAGRGLSPELQSYVRTRLAAIRP